MRVLLIAAFLIIAGALAGCDGCGDSPYAAPSDGTGSETYGD
jgi:hypothetical protein